MQSVGRTASERFLQGKRRRFCCWELAVLLLVAVGCGGQDDSKPVPLSQLVAQAQKEPDPRLRATELIRLADQQRRLGDLSGAGKTLLLARKACQQIEDPQAQAGAWFFLARAYARMNDPTQAKFFLQQGRRAMERIQQPGDRVATLLKLARAQAELKQDGQALATLRQAEQQAKDIPLGNGTDELPLLEKGSLLVQLAAAYSRLGRKDEAQRVVEALLALEATCKTPRQRSRLWTLVAQARHQGRLDGVDEAWRKAQQYAAQIEEPLSRGHAWVDLAEAAASVSRSAEAARLLGQAQKAADQMRPGSLKNELQERIARARR